MLHEKWKKALSETDRHLVEMIFRRSRGSDELTFQNIRVAKNYQQDILATVLIENFTQNQVSLPFTLMYCEKNRKVAEFHFADYQLDLPAYTSMPWTFIFPKHCILCEPEFSDWHLDLKR